MRKEAVDARLKWAIGRDPLKVTWELAVGRADPKREGTARAVAVAAETGNRGNLLQVPRSSSSLLCTRFQSRMFKLAARRSLGVALRGVKVG